MFGAGVDTLTHTVTNCKMTKGHFYQLSYGNILAGIYTYFLNKLNYFCPIGGRRT